MSSLAPNSPHDQGITPELPLNLAQEPPELPMSKNKLKKLLRDQKWEEGREKRKELRKAKARGKKEKKRAAQINGNRPPLDSTHEKRAASAEPAAPAAKTPKTMKSAQLPVSFVIDCHFDDLMRDHERTSLASQITRSYSENHKAPFQSHLFVSSFGGLLKQRFDTILAGHHRSWKGVKFLEGDLEAAASEAANLMKTDRRGRLAGAFRESGVEQDAQAATSTVGEVVYLTSDSSETLTELKPYGTYIIGGIVDKNRHKGICHKRAADRGFRTAKLPIGDYMKMSSRFVLATNHVVEIMLKWLELGDWGKAFLEVIPQRKGGVLKDGLVKDSMIVFDRDSEATTPAGSEVEEDQEDGAITGKNVETSNKSDVATDVPEHGEKNQP
ncbi:MAG: hypothetical protein Q9169_000584 [Polycauliona sp. 2 TL-2023]